MTKICSPPHEGELAYTYKLDLEHLIGEGGFADVFRVIRKHDQKEFALKRSKRPLGMYNDLDQQALREEIRIMKDNSHPFIVKLIDDFVDNAGH